MLKSCELYMCVFTSFQKMFESHPPLPIHPASGYHAFIEPRSQALTKKIVKAPFPAPRPVAIVHIIVIRSHRGLLSSCHRRSSFRPQAFCVVRVLFGRKPSALCVCDQTITTS